MGDSVRQSLGIKFRMLVEWNVSILPVQDSLPVNFEIVVYLGLPVQDVDPLCFTIDLEFLVLVRIQEPRIDVDEYSNQDAEMVLVCQLGGTDAHSPGVRHCSGTVQAVKS